MRITTALALACLCACSSDPATERTSDPTTVEPDASADASLPDPDARVDDTDLEAPDVVQPETGTDAGPDARVDDVDDADAEVSPPEPACLGPLNTAITDAAAIQTLAIERATTCARTEPEDLAACTVLQLDDLEVTTSCRDCVADLGACGVEACADACVEDATSVDCGWCMVEAGCAEAWLGCAGVEAWAPEAACPDAQPGEWGGIEFARNCARANEDVASCTAESLQTVAGVDARCAECSGAYGARLLDECPSCIEERDSLACLDCASRAEAISFGTYCGGVTPATYEP